MYAIIITAISLFILLGYEIRHREISETLSALKTLTNAMAEDIEKLKSEIKLKKNIYEEHTGHLS